MLNPFKTLSTNPTEWSNTLKQFLAKFQTNSLSVFDHFVGLALKRLMPLVSFYKNIRKPLVSGVFWRFKKEAGMKWVHKSAFVYSHKSTLLTVKLDHIALHDLFQDHQHLNAFEIYQSYG